MRKLWLFSGLKICNTVFYVLVFAKAFVLFFGSKSSHFRVMKRIHLSEVLGEIDVKIRNGRRVYFSITFTIEATGEVRHYNRAVATGLRNINLKSRAMRGVKPVDRNGMGIGHPTPCNIFGIIKFNGKKVYQ